MRIVFLIDELYETFKYIGTRVNNLISVIIRKKSDLRIVVANIERTLAPRLERVMEILQRSSNFFRLSCKMIENFG